MSEGKPAQTPQERQSERLYRLMIEMSKAEQRRDKTRRSIAKMKPPRAG